MKHVLKRNQKYSKINKNNGALFKKNNAKFKNERKY